MVDKSLELNSLYDHAKKLLPKFPKHRFNVQHTKVQVENLISKLKPDEILKFQDFSQNYTCLLPEEVMSMHWVQETATLYPVVVVRKIEDKMREEHFIFISDDHKHDVAFVEASNVIIHNYYKEKGLEINHDFELNDGCASQFKSRKAITNFGRRPMKSTRMGGLKVVTAKTDPME